MRYKPAMRKADLENTELRRRQILDAALLCFREKGFAGASIGDICKLAGMSPGHLYHYFGSKDEIVTAIAAEDRSQAVETLKALGREKPLIDAILGALDPAAELGDYGLDGSLAFDVFAEASRNARVAAAVTSLYGEVSLGLARLIRGEQAGGRLPENVDPHGAAIAIMALIEGLVVVGVSHDEQAIASASPAVRRAIRAILGIPAADTEDSPAPLRTRRGAAPRQD